MGRIEREGAFTGSRFILLLARDGHECRRLSRKMSEGGGDQSL